MGLETRQLTPSVVVGPGRGQATSTVWGDLVTALVGGAQTENRLCAVELTAEPGWRRRTYIDGQADECFYILQGEFDVDLGDCRDPVRAEAGCLLYVPSGLARALRNAGDSPGRLLIMRLPRAARE